MKYRLRENQHGEILLQNRNPQTYRWETLERYPNLEAYQQDSITVGLPKNVSFRGPRDKAQVIE